MKFSPFAFTSILFIRLIFSGALTGQNVKNLYSLNGAKTTLFEIVGDSGAVFVFYSTTCPVCRNYTRTMNALIEKYKNEKLNFFAVFSGGKFENGEIQAYVEKYRFRPKLLIDNKYKLANRFSAKITPEAVLVDSTGKVRYRGAIDNWVIRLGATRDSATENYLKDAINELLKGKEVSIKTARAIGCFIK